MTDLPGEWDDEHQIIKLTIQIEITESNLINTPMIK